EITTITNQSSSKQKPATIITIWDLPEDAKNLQSKQDIATQEKEPIENKHKVSLRYEQYWFTTRKETTRENTGKTEQFRRKAGNTCPAHQMGALVQLKIIRERSSQYKQSRTIQQTSENSSASSFQTSRQLLKSCDNSAAP
ncbi:34461_t:CDS:2, partial [Gigaspora margarita]